MQPHAPHSILFLCTCICELTHVCFFLLFSPFGGGRVAVRNIFCATLRPLQPSPHSFLFELLHFKLESHPSMDPPPPPPPDHPTLHLHNPPALFFSPSLSGSQSPTHEGISVPISQHLCPLPPPSHTLPPLLLLLCPTYNVAPRPATITFK